MIIILKNKDRQKKIECSAGDNLLSLMINNGINVPADCGGHGLCGKCRVKLIEGKISGTEPDENSCLLSCLCTLTEPAVFETFFPLYGEEKEISSAEIVNKNHSFGIAFDLGSTTLAFSLVDMTENKVIESFTELNKQSVFGADVISRISASDSGKLENLHETVINQLIAAEKYFRIKYGYEKTDKITVAGNTAMLHIFMNVSPHSLGVSPYTPVFTERKIFDGSIFSIPCSHVEVFPSCGAFIGGDITSGAAYLKLSDSEMLIDLGTNGEIIYRKADKYYGTSAAAGPCLEGASTECGTGGIRGAVNKVYEENNKVKFLTVDNAPPVGICGAGLVDLISLLLEKNIIDETGYLSSPDERYSLTEDIYLTSADVREFQLAKSAVYSAILTLMHETGEDIENIKTFYLAGGIGYHIDVINAVRAGLLPESIKDKVKIAGNSSLKGAELCLTDRSFAEKTDYISENTEIIDLNSSKYFSDAYIMNMMFN